MELTFMLVLLTFFSLVFPPLLFSACQARRILFFGTKSVSLKMLFNEYFKTLIRFAVMGHVPSAAGVVSLVAPIHMEQFLSLSNVYPPEHLYGLFLVPLPVLFVLSCFTRMHSLELSAFEQKSILPESSTEMITFGATKADLDVGNGGSCTRSRAQLAAGVRATPIAKASRFFLYEKGLVRNMMYSSESNSKISKIGSNACLISVNSYF